MILIKKTLIKKGSFINKQKKSVIILHFLLIFIIKYFLNKREKIIIEL